MTKDSGNTDEQGTVMLMNSDMVEPKRVRVPVPVDADVFVEKSLRVPMFFSLWGMRTPCSVNTVFPYSVNAVFPYALD